MYNVVGIPLAAGALLPGFGIALNPSVAGGMMAMSSVAVVANSLLLRAQSLNVAATNSTRKGDGVVQEKAQRQRDAVQGAAWS